MSASRAVSSSSPLLVQFYQAVGEMLHKPQELAMHFVQWREACHQRAIARQQAVAAVAVEQLNRVAASYAKDPNVQGNYDKWMDKRVAVIRAVEKFNRVAHGMWRAELAVNIKHTRTDLHAYIIIQAVQMLFFGKVPEWPRIWRQYEELAVRITMV